MITDIEDYFSKGCGRCQRSEKPDCSALLWKQGLYDLRRICLGLGLVETTKWGHPCYMHANRNIAILGAFQSNFRLNFFNAALRKDKEKVLEKQGPNTLNPSMIRFSGNTQVSDQKVVIISYLKEAMAYADAGISPAKVETDIEMLDELKEALDSDPELTEAFYSLTPGRQKSY